jgi:hypothetical protein
MLKTSMFFISLPLLILILCILGVAPASAQASRTWVSGVGDDANPCSRTAPCKTFAGSIAKTAAGGEINCLDPGGFGAVTITKAVTIDCSGTYGSTLVSGTNGIVVNAGATDVVILRGLSVNGLATGINGIRFLAGAQLTVERCIVFGFTNNAIDIATTATADVYISNTYITKSNKGVVAATTTGALIVLVNNTDIVNVTANAFEAAGGAVLGTLTNSRLTSANGGVVASAANAQLNVDTSSIVNNDIAFSVVAGATTRVSNNNIYGNATNFSIAAGGAILSTGNNRITTGGGAPSGSISVQ